MFPACTMVACRAAAASFSKSSRARPVVPITWTRRACAASSAWATVPAGAVKSSAACDTAKTSMGSSVTTTPSGAAPSASPRSRPIQGWPGRSVAPDRRASGVARTASISIRPMRPEQPSTAIPTFSAMVPSPPEPPDLTSEARDRM